MVEPLQHIVNDVYQPYITTIHQSIKSRRFSKFKITRTLKPNNIAVAYIAIASHFTSNVYNDSSNKIFPCVLINVLRIPLTVLICLSQAPTMWLVVKGLLIQVIQSMSFVHLQVFVYPSVVHVLERFPQFWNCSNKVTSVVKPHWSTVSSSPCKSL